MDYVLKAAHGQHLSVALPTKHAVDSLSFGTPCHDVLS